MLLLFFSVLCEVMSCPVSKVQTLAEQLGGIAYT